MANTDDDVAYQDFEVRVNFQTDQGYPVAVRQSSAGDASAFFTTDLYSKLLRATLHAREARTADEASLIWLGDLLFNALFGGEIATLFRSNLSLARSQNVRLRIRLVIEPPELAYLPWELIHDPVEDTFLAISTETSLVRYIPVQAPARLAAVTLPLRILIVAAGGQDMPSLDTAHELMLIREALAELTTSGQIQIYVLEHATIARINEAMRRVRPHVFHFIGHSVFQQEQALIALEDDVGNARFINERSFREFFVGFPDARLVVLNSCQSATTSPDRALIGLAPRLLQRHVTAVVAMQYPLENATSFIFAREFYRSIAQGYSIEAAVADARRVIYLESDGQKTDWGSPVLFLRSPHSCLFELQKKAENSKDTNTAPNQDTVQKRAISTKYIDTAGGDFIGRNKIVLGDEVHGDKVTGNKTEFHIERIEAGTRVIFGEVHINQAAPVDIPAPPKPMRPPEPPIFTGREQELAHYVERLQTTGLAVISGMAGVGKTALASVLARRMATPDRIFWHSFHAQESFGIIIWQLAAFLANDGKEDLWRMLQSARQMGEQLPPDEVLFDYAFQLLRRQNYLLCLDDLQFVDEDPLFAGQMERLLGLLAEGDLRLIVTSRRLPDFSLSSEMEALTGLDKADTGAFLAACKLSLTDSLIAHLHSQTGGNAQLLTLAVDAIRHTHDPARLIAHLAETDNIERYLMQQIDRGLTADERAAMEAASVLLGHVGTRDAIEAIGVGHNIGRVLRGLASRYLLVVSETEHGRVYGLHAMLQSFYYDLLGRRERVTMHLRAGDFYAQVEPDVLKAAHHYQCAGETKRAAALATQDVWSIINQGQSWALLQILDGFAPEHLDVLLQVKVNLARGQILTLLGEGEVAHKNFESALQLSSTLPITSELREFRAQVYEGMGRLLEQESPDQALAWLQRGLEELAGIGDQSEAALYVRIGSVHIATGDYPAALAALEKALNLLPQEPSQLRASALMNIGNIYSSQGDISKGTSYARAAMEIGRQLHNPFLLLAIQSNLGIDKEIAGDWQGAIADYREALALAERLGSVADQVRLGVSLGTLYIKLGDDGLANEHLTHVIDSARQHRNREVLTYALATLADLRLRMGELDMAEPLLDEAVRVAAELGIDSILAEVSYLRAQLCLGRGQTQDALRCAERAATLVHEFGQPLEEGKYLRVLACAQAANHQHGQAIKTLEKSLVLLADQDPYEAACTRLVWGQILVDHGDTEQGEILLLEASSAFRRLGAQRELGKLIAS